MEDVSTNISRAGHIDIQQNARTGDVIKPDSYSIDPTTNEVLPSVEEAPMQLLQRGFVIPGSEVQEYNSSDLAQGGPIDVTDIVDEVSETDGVPNQAELTEIFKNIGNLYYGKKVYVKNIRKYYYYSKTGIWKEMR